MTDHNAFLSYVSMLFIDKTDPSDPLQRENYRIRALKIMVSTSPFLYRIFWHPSGRSYFA